MITFSTQNAIKDKILTSYVKKVEKANEYLFAKKYSEFLTLPDQNISRILEIGEKARKKFKDIIVMGIGGSVLGAQMLNNCLCCKREKTPNFHFLDNIDPMGIEKIEEIFSKKTTLFIVISKSGNTLETATTFSLINKKTKENIIIITENKEGLLYQYGKKNKITTIEMPKFVAGRYSVLTASGLLPATIMGLDTKKILLGSKKTLSTKIPEMLATIIYHLYTAKKKKTIALFPYIDSFEYFNKWVIQLISESLGKNNTIGPLPISLIGTKDQHSMLQLLIDGPKDKWILFTELEKRNKDYSINGIKYSQILKAEKTGTEQSLSEKHIPNATITIDKLDEENIGELIMIFEKATAIASELFGVNAFNQPAVEHSKTITREILLKLKK